MKPELELKPDAFLLNDLQMPQFYSLQFDFRIDEQPETNDGYLILGLTDGITNADNKPNPGYREPSIGIRHPNLVMIVTSDDKENAKHPISNKYNEWLSFILKMKTNPVVRPAVETCRLRKLEVNKNEGYSVRIIKAQTQVEIHKDQSSFYQII